jgi:hypothetical protein
MQAIVDFFNQPFFIILSGLATLATVLAVATVVYLTLRGVLPVWYRLGMGLSRRKIAVFANTEFDDLKQLLLDSGLFREANIVKIDHGSLKKAEGLTVFLVHWKSFAADIDAILSLKKDAAALIVYAPQAEGFISDKGVLARINEARNATIVNFRGRLLNDVLVSLLTTGYQAK